MEESKVTFENENENTELVETEATEVETYEEGGSFKNLALVGAVVAGVTALGTYAFRKLKDKKAGKPRIKKRLKWVEVEDDKVVNVDAEDAYVEENKIIEEKTTT